MGDEFEKNEMEAGRRIGEALLKLLLSEPVEPWDMNSIEEWLSQHPEDREVFDRLRNPQERKELLDRSKRMEEKVPEYYQAVYARMHPVPAETSPGKIRRILVYFAGAAAAILIGLSIFLFVKDPQKHITANPTPITFQDVAPGYDKAVLTLSNGSSVILDSTHAGLIALQGQTEIHQVGGKLTYQAKPDSKSPVYYNTISTGRGGQYHLVLADGTRVWLDAESSLKYPTAFSGSLREVELKGQGYFEVVHKSQLFVVHAGKTEITDLGTAFNVNGFPEQTGVQTTLVSGSVKVANGPDSKVLVPGQQATTDVGANATTSKIAVRDNVDTDAVVAWRNGEFNFVGADMATIFNTVSRWYDVKIINHTNITGRLVFSVSRNVPLSVFMRALERTNKLHYLIEGKTLTIEP